MRAPIGFKVAIGVLLIILFIIVPPLHSSLSFKQDIEDQIGEEAVVQAELLSADVDQRIHSLVVETGIVGHSTDIVRELSGSNIEFEQMEDRSEFMDQMDLEWTSAPEDEVTPFMQEVLDEPLSHQARRMFFEYYEDHHGGTVFTEVIITNRYGATVGMSSRSSDYRQDDEEWWKVANATGLYVSQFMEVGTTSFDFVVALRVTDHDGEFVGILRGTVNLFLIIKEAELNSLKTYNKETRVLTSEGLLVYHTRPFRYLEDLSGEAFFGRIEGRSGSFICEDMGGRRLYSYAASCCWGHQEGAGWTIVLSFDLDEAYGQINIIGVNQQRLIVSGAILTIAFMFFVVRSITRPIRSLVDGTREISNGNLTHKIEVRSNDEIHVLAREFNEMGSKLAASYDSMETMVRSRTKDLAIANHALMSAGVGVAITGEDGSIRLTNLAMMDFLGGTSPTDMLGMDLKEALAEVGVTEGKWADRCATNFLDGVCELATRREGESPRYYVIASYPVTDDDGQTSGNVLFARDITQGKVAEVQLQMTLSELERSNEALDQFANIASHDLQEPLRMISNYLQLLERRYTGQLDEDANEFIGYAVDGASRMQDMIRALLEFSRVTTLGQPLIPVDLDRIYDNAVANLELLIEESGAHLEKEELGWALGDEKQLTMLVQNLLNNGIKFRGENSPRILVSSRVVNGTVEVSVSDNGIGIDPEHTDRIFSIFHRLHTREKYPGSGIGLALCRRIVERHAGMIWVDQHQGPGSTFNFTLMTSTGISSQAQGRTS